MNKISPAIKVEDCILRNVNEIVKNRQKISLFESFCSNDLILWMKNKMELTAKIDENNKEIENYYKLICGDDAADLLKKDKSNFSALLNKFSREFQTIDELEEACKEILDYEVFLLNQSDQIIENWLFRSSDNVIMFSMLIYFEVRKADNKVRRKLKYMINQLSDVLDGFRLFTVKELKTSREIKKPFMLLNIGSGTRVEIISGNSVLLIDVHNFNNYKNIIFDKSKINMINSESFSKMRIVEVEYEF